jgi:hypothetical protein
MYATVRRWCLASRSFWIRRPYLTYLIVAMVAGMLLVVTFKLRGRGFVSAAGAGHAVIISIACLGAIFVGELIRPAPDRAPIERVIVAFLALGLSFVTVVLSVMVNAAVVPDPAMIYFHLRRPYIVSHWQVDEASELSYFPLDQSNFFVWDKNRRFFTDPYSDHLFSPRCPTAKYSVRLLESQTYIVFRYIDDPDETTIPCLITPSQKQAY